MKGIHKQTANNNRSIKWTIFCTNKIYRAYGLIIWAPMTHWCENVWGSIVCTSAIISTLVTPHIEGAWGVLSSTNPLAKSFFFFFLNFRNFLIALLKRGTEDAQAPSKPGHTIMHYVTYTRNSFQKTRIWEPSPLVTYHSYP